MVPKSTPKTVIEPLRISWPHDARSETDHAHSEKESREPPRHHRQGVSLLLIYVPFLLVPWVLTCMIWKQP